MATTTTDRLFGEFKGRHPEYDGPWYLWVYTVVYADFLNKTQSTEPAIDATLDSFILLFHTEYNLKITDKAYPIWLQDNQDKLVLYENGMTRKNVKEVISELRGIDHPDFVYAYTTFAELIDKLTDDMEKAGDSWPQYSKVQLIPVTRRGRSAAGGPVDEGKRDA